MSQQPRRERRREQTGAGATARTGAARRAGGPEVPVGAVTLPRPEGVEPAAAGRRRAGVPRRRTGAAPAEAGQVAPVDAVGAPPRRLRLTWEGAAYLLLLLAAALTRFWDLGSRALHHDESLHAYYSWVLASGDGYRHDPLMHGPFLFLANGLVYLLFGDSDATSRFMPALFGTVLVGLPYFLRGSRFLGRFGALATSVFFLISPGFLYYSRYIRHDLYTVVGALLLFTCLARYVESPRRGWLVGAGASLAFLLTNHEIVFAIVAIFVAVVWGALLWGRLRPLLPLQIGALSLAGAVVLAMPRIIGGGLPAIPWDRDGVETVKSTRANQLRYFRDLLTEPLVVALLVIGVAFVVGCWAVIRSERQWRGPVLAAAPPGTVEAAVLAAGRDRTGLWTALAVAALIFATLFTSFYTNIYGLATGTIATDGTLFYWLGQQNVQRGSQPWFYFLLLAPQYELLLVVLGVAGALVTLWRVVRRLRDPARHDPALLFHVWMAVWFAGLFLGLSYAGEKMPWLIVHFTLPGLLLAGALTGDLAERAVAAWQRARLLPTGPRAQAAGNAGLPALPLRRWAEAAWLGPGLAIALLALAGGWWLVAADLTYGEFARPAGALRRAVTDEAAERWWLLALPPLAALLLIAFAWLVRSAAFAGRWAAIALVVGLALLQVHVAWRLSYLEGDTPRDMLIYNQTSPDVTRMMREIGLLSAELTGGNGIVIWYDADTAWPMQWYLRDYPNRIYYGDRLNGPPPSDVALLLVSNDNLGLVQPYLSGYTPQEYVLRWHFPENETYRNFAIAPELPPGWSAWDTEAEPHGIGAVVGSIGDSVATQFDPEGQQRLYRLVLYRDLPVRITGFNYTLFIRNDLVPLFNGIRY